MTTETRGAEISRRHRQRSLGEIERRVPAGRGAAAAAQRRAGRDRQAGAAHQRPRQGDRRGAALPSTSSCPACCMRGCCARRIAHARILSIDTKAAERHAGVRAVHVID